MSNKAPTNERTVRGEKLAAELAAKPLMRETVLHSVRYLDGSVEKEVCDILLLHRGEAIVLSVKAQEKKRDLAATSRWLRKSAPKALAQLRGALRTLSERSSWCTHEDLGRVDLEPGRVAPRHALALLESHFEAEVDISDETLRLPSGSSATLMTVDDFIYLTHYLRTWRDLSRYLDARCAALRGPDTRTVGAEVALLGYYTAMRDSFDGCHGIADAKLVTARGLHVREGSAFRDREVRLASIVEDLMQGISTAKATEFPHDANFLKDRGESNEQLNRHRVREELCSLTIQERAELGEHIAYLSARATDECSAGGALYAAVRMGRDKVYVVVVGIDANLAELSVDALDMTIAAGVYYERPIGIGLVLTQVGNDTRFTVAWVGDIRPTLEMQLAGEEYFGHVRPRRIHQLR